MRDLQTLNRYEASCLKTLIANYKVYKAGEDQLHFIFANAIHTLLDIKAGKLKDLLTNDFIEEISILARK